MMLGDLKSEKAVFVLMRMLKDEKDEGGGSLQRFHCVQIAYNLQGALFVFFLYKLPVESRTDQRTIMLRHLFVSVIPTEAVLEKPSGCCLSVIASPAIPVSISRTLDLPNERLLTNCALGFFEERHRIMSLVKFTGGVDRN